MSLPTSVRRAVARHPVAAFLIIGNTVYLAAALTPALVATSSSNTGNTTWPVASLAKPKHSTSKSTNCTTTSSTPSDSGYVPPKPRSSPGATSSAT